MTLADLLRRAAENVPRKTAAIYREYRLSYEALHERTNRLANALLRLDLAKGDRLAVLIDNSHYAYEVIMGAAKAGIVLVPLNYMLKGRELSSIIRHAEAKALIIGDNHRPKVDVIRHELPSVKEWIVIGEGHEGVREYEALIRAGSSADPPTPLGEDDLFALLYTSGTTGLPKGTMLTHRNILSNVENAIREYRIDEESVGFTVLPYFVGATLNCIHFPCLSQGGTMVFERFSPRRFFEVIQEEGVTHVQVVPTMLIRLLESGDLRSFRWDSLKTFGYGSAPMPVDRLKQALQVFGPILLQIYGLTETTAMSTCLQKESHLVEGEGSRRLASCGRPVEGVEVKVVNDQGREVTPGEVGEIIIRGPTVMKGYWNLPDVTAESIREGWFYSGDLATVDEEGYLYITDRKKDMIISGGLNIYPKEIEEVLYTHPAVLECAVIGVPDKEWGEAVMAVIALKPGMEASPEELIEHCRCHLAGYKKPRSVVFVEEIPRNPSGKILKRLLRERFTVRH